MWIRILLGAAAAAGAIALLAGCATMNEEQCVAGDWSGRGFSDGAVGRGSSKLDDYTRDCAKHGVTPDAEAFYAGVQRGVRRWCLPANAFRVGRRGDGHSSTYCPAEMEPEFLVAYADGRLVYSAEFMASQKQARVTEASGRIYVLDERIRQEQARLEATGLTEDQQRAIRGAIRGLRDDRQRELDTIPALQADADDARREADSVLNRFIPTYGA